MSSHSIVQLLMVLWAIVSAADEIPSADTSQALPGCDSSCEDIIVPYPFGLKEGCYLEEQFHVTCNHEVEPHKLSLATSTVEVADILLSAGQLRILSDIASDCYNKNQVRGKRNSQTAFSDKFQVSSTRNKFTAVGCDTHGMFKSDDGRQLSTGCSSHCDRLDNPINGSCSGVGCCQATIPKDVKSFDINVTSFHNHSSVWEFNPCGYAFLVEEGNYSFSPADLLDLQNRTKTPVILDWAIGDQRCDQARKNVTSYACKGNSKCYDFDNGPGYRCNCSEGYEGNPYLDNGCVDINECNTASPCSMTCKNLPGTYNCSCPEGYEGDGTKDGSGCTFIVVPKKRLPIINISLGIGIAFLVLAAVCSLLYWFIKKRNNKKLREKLFQQNGGLMLQKRLSNRDGPMETAKIFTEDELKKATNGFDERRIVGRGGYGVVYKGVTSENKIIAIKKSKVVDQSQIEQFVNEVIVLYHVNHRNVVKLLGCCLDSQVPMLVYEFISNGTLFYHIHEVCYELVLPWPVRLRIAAETAGALAYLHSAASPPILHRDIKSANILLDDNFTAKVSDFGASRLVPMDQAQLTTMVQGTLGYLDPEYFQTSKLTEKSDVYSFGVVLVELITGRKAISFARPEAERNLATHFLLSVKENRLSELLEDRIVKENNVEQVHQVAVLAQSCLRVHGDDRPTMKEVAAELEGLMKVKNDEWVGVEVRPKETEHSLRESRDIGSTSSAAGIDSLNNNAILSLYDGR